MCKKNTTVSVIIPTFNSAEYVGNAIDSVLSQTYSAYEIIVVNDGSTDNTQEILKNYVKKILYFEIENGGPSKARNIGIIHSKGAFIAFLDADDEWYPQKLEKQVELIREKPKCGLVYCDRVVFDETTKRNTKMTYRESGKIYEGNMFWDMLKAGDGCFATSCVLLRRDALNLLGLFDEELYTAEDTNLLLRVAYHYEIEFVPETLAKIRIHSRNISHQNVRRWGTIQNLDKIAKLYPETVYKHEKLWTDLYAKKYFEYSMDLLLAGELLYSLKCMALSASRAFSLGKCWQYVICFLKKLYKNLFMRLSR
jgi:glycosyltransferase involved in cell wall biosynthesis